MRLLRKIYSKLQTAFFLAAHYFLASRHKIRVGRKLSIKGMPILRNKGSIELGRGVCIESIPDGEFCRSRLVTNYSSSRIVVGDNAVLRGTTLWVSTEIIIGDNFLSAPFVWIVDNDAHGTDPSKRDNHHAKASPIKIGNNVWVGYRAMILKGVTIGDNSVIAAGSVVTRDIPANCLAAGVPAKVVRRL